MARIGVGGTILIGTTLAIAWLDGGLSSLLVGSALTGGGYVLVRRKLTKNRLDREVSSMSLDCKKCGEQVTPTIAGVRTYKYDCACGHSWRGRR